MLLPGVAGAAVACALLVAGRWVVAGRSRSRGGVCVACCRALGCCRAWPEPRWRVRCLLPGAGLLPGVAGAAVACALLLPGAGLLPGVAGAAVARCAGRVSAAGG